MAARTTFATLLITTAVTGCTVPDAMNPLIYSNTQNTEVFGVRKVAAVEHVITTDVPTSAAFVTMPMQMGTVVNVSESRAGNGVEQKIVYNAGTSGNGENRVRIRMVNNSQWPKASSEPISLSSISQRHIVRELRSEFPYASMRISDKLHTNAYGAFGYAVSSTKTGCLYGWQRVRADERKRWKMFSGASKQTKIGLRVRFCRPGASEDQLVGLMRNLRINADPAAALQASRPNWTARPVDSGSNVIQPNDGEAGYVSTPPAFAEPETKPTVQRPVRKQVRKSPVRRTVVRERYVEPRVVEKRTVEPVVQKPSRAFRTAKQVPLPPTGYANTAPVTPQPVLPQYAVPRQTTPQVVPRVPLRQPQAETRSANLPVLPAPSNARPSVEMPTIRSTIPAMSSPKPIRPSQPKVRKLDASTDGKPVRVIPMPG